jgi:hypothetical protein
MNETLILEILAELKGRGCSDEGRAPNGTMTMSNQFLRTVEIDELIDLVIRRREKIAHNFGEFDDEDARAAYDDVRLIVEAVEAVIRKRLA